MPATTGGRPTSKTRKKVYHRPSAPAPAPSTAPRYRGIPSPAAARKSPTKANTGVLKTQPFRIRATQSRKIRKVVQHEQLKTFKSEQAARRSATKLNRILPEPARELSGMSRRRWVKTMPKSDNRSFVEKALGKASSTVAKPIKKAATKAFTVHMPTGHGPGTTRKQELFPGPLVKEGTDLASNLPTGMYLTGAALKEAATGDTKRIKSQIKSFQETSALSTRGIPLKERLHRAEKRPLTTYLEVAGGYGAVGRLGRRAVRTTKKGRRYTNQQRPAVGHRAYERTGVPGPHTGRDYSKNIFTQIAQKRTDRRAAEQRNARKPAHERENFVVEHENKARRAREHAPGAPSLEKRVDTREYAQRQRLRNRELQARTEAHKLQEAAGKLGSRRPKRRRAEREARAEVIRAVATGELDHRNVRAEIQRALDETNKAEAAARAESPRHHQLNREEAAKLEGALRLTDDQLGKLVGTARTVEAKNAPRLARQREEGILTEGQGRHRWQQRAMRTERPTGRRNPKAGEQPESGRVAGTVVEDQAKIMKGDVPSEWVGPSKWDIPDAAVKAIKQQLGITGAVHIRKISGTRGYYAHRRGVHEVGIVGWLKPAKARQQLRHELEHAAQAERYGRGETPEHMLPTLPETPSAYRSLPTEVAAREAQRHTTPFDVEVVPEANRLIRGGRAKPPRVGGTPTARRLAAKLARTRRPSIAVATERQATRKMVAKGKSTTGKEQAVRRSDLEQATRALERRARRGKSLPEGPGTRGPVHISQRPRGVGAPIGLEPMSLPVGKASGEAYLERARPTGLEGLESHFAQSERLAASAESRHANLREFGIPAGSGGRVFADSHAQALKRASQLEAKNGVAYDPVRIADNTVTGPRLRQVQMRTDPTGTTGKGARAESGNGRWLLVPREVNRRFQAHENVTRTQADSKFARKLTGTFKDVVLTTVNPASWLTSNITDLAFRGLMEGLTPLDIVRGRKASAMMKRGDFGPQGEEAFNALTGGGMYGASEALVTRGAHGNPIMRPFRGYRDFIYHFEHGLERSLQDATLGKAMRTHTDRVMGRDLKMLAKLHSQQIEAFARKASTDRTFEAKLQQATEHVIGRWGKVSPNMRKFLSVAPFAQWLGAATRYVYVTLPAHHPIKTGILAGVMQMTEEERIRLGLSYFAPVGKQRQGYTMGMLPTDVGKNKYGPTVSGIRTSHMLSFGTAGQALGGGNLQRFMLPQISGPLTAAFGNSWQGERLVYPPWWPDKKARGMELSVEDKAKIALGMFMESTIPFAATARKQLMEKGRSSYPTSTILAPESRRQRIGKSNKYKFDTRDKSTALLDWVDPVAMGPAYTNEAIKAMRENEATFGPTGTMSRLRKRQQSKGKVRPKPGTQRKSPFGK